MSHAAEPADRRSLLQSSLAAIEALEARLATAEGARTEPIAVVGMGCRFPGGVDTPEGFWQLLREGQDAVTELPPERRAIVAALGVDVIDETAGQTWYGGFLEGIDRFEPQFFGITPREAATMDPQQRLVLEVAWEALERAGVAPDSLAGSRTGVFLGISTNDYSDVVRGLGYDHLDAYAATGSSMNVAAGRVAFVLGLQGPALAVDTACSSSLVAVHLAVQSLRNRESNLALAGGVNVVLAPDGFVTFARWGMMARDGRCKAFDARADGFVRAEGCGLVVLKRLREAQADGDPILAVIRGSAVNQDGRSSGLTVPNGRAQQAMLRAALADAGLAPVQVQYVEAHGTGTALGDPIEVEAIGAVLGQGRASDQPLFLSSVKTNIGHAESAAGIAAMIKVILAMQHGELPPVLHLRQRSPTIPWPAFPIEIPVTPTPWPATDGQRIAGVSGFGFSGTNAHVLLSSAPAPTPPATDRSEPAPHLLALSARSEGSLQAAAARLATHLAVHPALDLADICSSANSGRAHFAHRLALTASTPVEVRERLQAFAEGTAGGGLVSGRAPAGPPRVGFLFTGQGAQYAGMGRALYQAEPAFRAALDHCADLLAPVLDVSLLDLLDGAASDRLDQTGFTQPALFALEYALTELWRSWGITPLAVLGHSVGEYVAAVVAGVLSLADGLRVVAARGRLMQSLPAGGAMAAIFAPPAEVEAAIAAHGDSLAVAALNGPAHTVVSGAAMLVERVVAQATARGVRAQWLTVSHAFHSPLMEPILDQFEQVVAGVDLQVPRLPLISNLSGGVAGAEVTAPDYWRRHLREPVRFGDGLTALRDLGVDTLVEIGPQPVLLGLAQQVLADGQRLVGLPSLRRRRDDRQQMRDSLGQLYVRGASVTWRALDQGGRRRTVVLPTYPFQRERCWVEPPALSGGRDRRRSGHPLLGRCTSSPLLRDMLFESEVGAAEPAYLADHRIHDAVVFPGTAYLELALAAAASAGAASVSVSTLSLREPLVLDGEPHVLHSLLTPADDGAWTMQIASFRPDQPAGARTHARGLVQVADRPPAPDGIDVADLQRRCPEPVDVEAYYAALADRGLDYGPAFRGLTALWRGQDVALGRVSLPETAGASHGYQLHPALLDACFHVVGATVSTGEIGVPVAVTGLHLFKPAPTSVWCFAERIVTGADSDATLSCRLRLLDEAGQPVAELERLEVVRPSRSTWGGSVDGWFHQLAWRPQPRAATALSTSLGRWLVLAASACQADALAERLTARGAAVTVVLPGPVSHRHGADRWQVDLTDPAAFEPILDAGPPVSGVVCLWTDAGAGAMVSVADLTARQAQICSGTLHLTQALARRAGDPPRLWLVTRGTQPVEPAATSVTPVDAPLWGLGRVIAREHPALVCSLVDLDPAGHDDLLVDELLAPDRETQLAVRGGMRLAARLTRRVSTGLTPPAAPYRLAVPQRGQLDSLTYQPQAPSAPGPGEVAVTVHATGLNFRDVLNVLGLYPGDPGPPGIECAGVVAAVGPGSTEFAVGDAVVGLAVRSFDSVVVTPARLLAHKPAAVSFADAATIPSAFLTALYGLSSVAGLRAGERVLIHAAAGGVGLAAVQVAQRLGAEVFATAGSPAKHAHLRAIGVHHIFSSRTADFREPLMAATGGRGVDVVLNSLSDDFISDSFAVLAPGGRFLEIGKRGIWTEAQAHAVRPDVRYLPYDLGEVLSRAPDQIQALLQEVMAGLSSGALTPLPLHAFPVEATVDAFRYMAQARHIGKVVVTHRPAAWAGVVQADGAYLITGGLGGLGLRVAGWLAEQGARHLALLGRRPPTPAAAATVEALRATGVTVQVLAGDVARPDAIEEALAQIAATGRPLRGVFHAAGVLDDGVLQQQTWSRFVTVFEPKVAGAWNLHLATRGAPLDHFVLFSSASALLGNPGQANYAAANAFLDALAHQRRAAGLPAISINWGAWAEVGMVAALGGRHQGRLTGQGVALIAPDQGLQALARIITRSDAQVAVLPMRWAALLDQAAVGAAPPLFDELAPATSPRPVGSAITLDDGVAFRQRLATASVDERHLLFVQRLTLHVARVMGLDAQATDPSRSLSDLGIDSLMAVELKNRIDSDLRVSVPVTTLLAGPAIDELAAELVGAGGDPDPTASAAPAAASPAERTPEQVLASLDTLSDDDVDVMLTALLAHQGSAE